MNIITRTFNIRLESIKMLIVVQKVLTLLLTIYDTKRIITQKYKATDITLKVTYQQMQNINANFFAHSFCVK